MSGACEISPPCYPSDYRAIDANSFSSSAPDTVSQLQVSDSLTELKDARLNLAPRHADKATELRERNHIVALDGLRGVAALFVVAGHGFISIGMPEAIPAYYLPVDLFFSLSGYVLANAYEAPLSRGMSVTDFMKRRLIRLYPMLVLGIAAAAAAAIVKIVVMRDAGNILPLMSWIVFGLLYLPSFGALVPYPLMGPAWSLTCELVANLIYACSYRLLSDRVVSAIVALSGAALVLAMFRFGTINEIGHWWSIWVGFARVFFSFFAGLLIYRHRDRIPGAFAKLPTELLLIGFGLYLFIPGSTGLLANARDLVFVAALSPLLVAAGSVSRAWIDASNGLMRVLGGASYPVYALHWPLSLRLHALATAGTGLEILAVVLFTACSAGLGFLADQLIDRPVRSYLARRLIPNDDPSKLQPKLATAQPPSAVL
jgi:peptidoglycan/LPS O-acetylase OafA/YrhL